MNKNEELKDEVLKFMEAEQDGEWVHPVSLWFQGEDDPLSYIKTPKNILDFSDFILRYTHAGWTISADDYMAEAALLKLCLYIMLCEYPNEMYLKNLYTILRMCNCVISPRDMHVDFEQDFVTAFETFYEDLMKIGYRHNESFLPTYDHYFQLFANSSAIDITEIANRLIDRLDEAKYLYGDEKFFELPANTAATPGKKPNAKARTREEGSKPTGARLKNTLPGFLQRYQSSVTTEGQRRHTRSKENDKSAFDHCKVLEADNGDMMFFPE